MTQDELDALAINPSGFDYEEIPLPDARYPNAQGSIINVPKSAKQTLMHIGEDDYAYITDRGGNIWTTGSINGVKHKQRVLF